MHILISSKPPLGLLAVSLQFANCRIKCNNVLFNSEQEIYTIHSHHTKHNSYNHPPISLLKLTQTLCNLSKYSRVYWDTKHTWANIPVFIGTSNILEQIFPCLLLGHQTYFSKYSRVYWDTKHTWANIPVFIGTLCPNYSLVITWYKTGVLRIWRKLIFFWGGGMSWHLEFQVMILKVIIIPVQFLIISLRGLICGRSLLCE